MNRTTFLVSATIGVFAVTTTAFAHEMDTDQDGLYSLTEMRTEYADLTEAQYADLDINKDEAVDADELAAAIANGTLASME